MELVWEYALHADIWHFGIHENDLGMPILAETLPNECRKPYKVKSNQEIMRVLVQLLFRTALVSKIFK